MFTFWISFNETKMNHENRGYPELRLVLAIRFKITISSNIRYFQKNVHWWTSDCSNLRTFEQRFSTFGGQCSSDHHQNIRRKWIVILDTKTKRSYIFSWKPAKRNLLSLKLVFIINWFFTYRWTVIKLWSNFGPWTMNCSICLKRNWCFVDPGL